jgi:DNA repair exonuclease SbcCD ATPase subunit
MRAKTGGRQRGSVNKTTKELRERIKEVVDMELQNIEAILEKLTEKERTDLLTKLLPFVLPKMNEHFVESKEPFNPIQIIISDDHYND